MAYLTRSPVQTADGLKTWDGDGDYFKIAARGSYNETWWWNPSREVINNSVWQWCVFQLQSHIQMISSLMDHANRNFIKWNFTIPATTPPGLYLLRIDSIYPISRTNSAQLYASCAQVEIVGLGGGIPGPLARFPGAYTAFNDSMLNGFCFLSKK